MRDRGSLSVEVMVVLGLVALIVVGVVIRSTDAGFSTQFAT